VPRSRLGRHRDIAAAGVGVSIRVLVADDQDLVRTGLRLILGTLDGIEVVGEARDGQEAVRLARELRPDMCLMDIRMPVLDGVEATRLLAGPGVQDPVAVVVRAMANIRTPTPPIASATPGQLKKSAMVAGTRMIARPATASRPEPQRTSE
jgi:CheY-like chemotaxis protein